MTYGGTSAYNILACREQPLNEQLENLDKIISKKIKIC